MVRFGWVVVFAGLAGLAMAAQPPRFNYQAKLSDGFGAPLQGNHSLEFQIYQGGTAGGASSGVLVFQEFVNVTAVNGVVNATVGTGTGQTPGPLTANMLRTNGDVYLQVAVDLGANIILPRTRLESVPYAISSADGDPRIPIGQPASFPIIIDKPGSYYLTENVIGDSTHDGIQVTTTGVRLDLGGFSIVGRNVPSTNGVNSTSQVEIRNGSVRNWYRGIYAGQARVRDVVAESNLVLGMVVGDDSTVENCTVRNTKGGDSSVSGISTGGHCIVRDCVCANNGPSPDGYSCFGIFCGDNCLVSGCNSSLNATVGVGGCYGIRTSQDSRVVNNVSSSNVNYSGSGAGIAIGIYCSGAGCNVSGNTCGSNGSEASGGSGYGIQVYSRTLVRENTCDNNYASNAGIAAGIVTSGERNRVENNLCTDQNGSISKNYGILSQAGCYGSTFIKNTTSGNGDFGLRFENSTGPNYYAENVFDESPAVNEVTPALNTPGTGDRTNVTF